MVNHYCIVNYMWAANNYSIIMDSFVVKAT